MICSRCRSANRRQKRKLKSFHSMCDFCSLTVVIICLATTFNIYATSFIYFWYFPSPQSNLSPTVIPRKDYISNVHKSEPIKSDTFSESIRNDIDYTQFCWLRVNGSWSRAYRDKNSYHEKVYQRIWDNDVPKKFQKYFRPREPPKNQQSCERESSLGWNLKAECDFLSPDDYEEALKGQTIVFTGDSVSHQRYVGSTINLPSSVNVIHADLPTIGLTHDEMDSMLKDFLTTKYDRTNAVMFVNVGVWYNLPYRCFATNDFIDEEECGYSKSSFSPLSDQKAKDMGLGGWGARRIYRRKHNGLSPYYLKNGVRLLLKWIRQNRDKLPHRIFWLQTLPQHFYPNGAFPKKDRVDQNGVVIGPQKGDLLCVPLNNRTETISNWRNELVDPIVTDQSRLDIVMTDYLNARWSDHIDYNPGSSHDCTHWCYDSPGFQTHLDHLLTVAWISKHLKCYAERYESLLEGYCDNDVRFCIWSRLFGHYLAHGQAEGRKFKCD